MTRVTSPQLGLARVLVQGLSYPQGSAHTDSKRQFIATEKGPFHRDSTGTSTVTWVAPTSERVAGG